VPARRGFAIAGAIRRHRRGVPSVDLSKWRPTPLRARIMRRRDSMHCVDGIFIYMMRSSVMVVEAPSPDRRAVWRGTGASAARVVLPHFHGLLS
jgi:hypothetical protein